jgi:hypothetical protein
MTQSPCSLKIGAGFVHTETGFGIWGVRRHRLMQRNGLNPDISWSLREFSTPAACQFHRLWSRERVVVRFLCQVLNSVSPCILMHPPTLSSYAIQAGRVDGAEGGGSIDDALQRAFDHSFNLRATRMRDRIDKYASTSKLVRCFCFQD